MYYHIVKAFDRYVSPIIRIGPSPNRKITDTQCRFRMCKHYIMSITTLRSLPVWPVGDGIGGATIPPSANRLQTG